MANALGLKAILRSLQACESGVYLFASTDRSTAVYLVLAPVSGGLVTRAFCLLDSASAALEGGLFA